MFGTNPIRSRSDYDRDHLRVQDVFLTIQGEGPYAGTPAVFLRLAGCNLRCQFCDTDFESSWDNKQTHLAVSQLIYEALGDFGADLVVITGGEPMLQHLGPLLRLLQNGDVIKHVQIETAGTVWDDSITTFLASRYLSLVCSPKSGGVHAMVDLYCKHWKYIIKADDQHHDDGFPISRTQPPSSSKPVSLFRPRGVGNTIYFQPCDEGPTKTPDNTTKAIQLALRTGNRLCLQQHKLIGLP